MTENTPPIYRSFHPIIENAYTVVHQWLGTNVQEANGYKDLTYTNLKQKLQESDWKHIAFQYYALFPAHYFKAVHTLDYIVGEEKLITWLRHRQIVCLLDVGCGAGAGSIAFIEAVIRLKEEGKLTNDVNIICIGVDPSHRAIGLYIKMMKNLKSSLTGIVDLNFDYVYKGFPDATIDLIRILKKQKSLSKLPCLTNVLIMQLNVISPFSKNYRDCQANIDELKELGIDIAGEIGEESAGLGTAEAQAYKQLVEDVPIDVMHILTIGTKNMEKQVQLGTNSEITLDERIKQMASTLHEVVGSRHTINQLTSGHHFVYFTNPPNCFWLDKKGITQYDKEFYADFQTIWSADRAEDQDWNGVTSLDNLKLAWARARNNLLKETLCDETEMRLFELSLDTRLEEMREQLNAYAGDVAKTDEMLSYKVPKNITVTRPKGLSRIEEEILSVAIIQRLGDKASQLRGSSYAYRIAGKHGHRDTEYLYEYWFKAYCYYMKKARDSANNYANGAILRVDIESFYTKIIQEQLCDGLSRELTVSQRVRWLIRLLLSKNIDEHEFGQGITQGSIGSHFYANIYLTPIDARFGSGNEWGVEFHRYVDDIILIIPNPEDTHEIKNVLGDELKKLGLNFNEEKTEEDNICSFLQQSNDDEYLERLSDRFDSVVNPLWILNSEHRAIFASFYHNDQLWWHNIQCYEQCLKTIKIYTHGTELSRKIYKYLFSSKSRDKDLAKQKEVFGMEGELKSTQVPDSDTLNAILQWAASFTISNNIWNENRNDLRRELVDLFKNSWQDWQELRKSNSDNSSETRKLQRYIRFALYRLSVLGFEDILHVLMEILREAFWIIRDPINILENLARQGYLAEIRSLLVYYQNLEQPVEYLKAITIRAMRFLPDIDAQEWELIVEFATISDGSVSVAERLMATESWLYLGHKYNDFKQSHHIDAVKKALQSEPSSRLKKNYFLLLGQFEPNAVQEFSINVNDPMLVDARNIALQGNPSDIFDLPELKILRENYYSGQGPTDSEEGSP
ncbi:hypothetical protein A4S05_24475 [Nostoc sp. KVJ20]|uniref:RNA-directed DNA polymerase n=1 Tax=Nostoc sp. KVJ20 TaxID=457944 RepID=UPI00083E0AB3|nr:RNA-directed DNA polymerase [Nostoc sp. KVJ20]ODH02426.1 hypothetical protein A4S05_24475 [Nostoc sp. KVJ20]